MNKIYSISYIISILFLLASCNKQEMTNADSLELESLKRVSSSTLTISEGLQNARNLENQAKKENNNLYLGYAYKNMMLYYLNMEKKDSAYYFSEMANTYFQKENNQQEIISLKMNLIKWEANYGNVSMALDRMNTLMTEIQILGDRELEFFAYELLVNIYTVLNKPNEAMNSLNQMMEIRSKYKIDIGANTFFIFLNAAGTAIELKNYELGLNYCDSMKYYMNKYPIIDNIQSNLFLNLNLAKCYIKTNQLDKAKITLDQSMVIYADTTKIPYDKFYYYLQALYSNYYFHKKKYDKALESIDIAADKFLNIGDSRNYNEAKKSKEDILEAMGRYKELYQLRNEMTSYMDSVQTDETLKKIRDIKNNYEIEKLTESNKFNAKYTLTIILSLLVVCLLLAAILIINNINSKKIKRKNKQIFEHYRTLDKYEDEVVKDPKTDARSSLYQRIETYLQENKAFKHPSFSRENLATELNTNRQYITEAIQEAKNMTFMEYINSLRLDYARRLLIYNEELSIDEIYVQAGFNSKRTFYRLFKQKYDLAPKELREIVIEEKKHYK